MEKKLQNSLKDSIRGHRKRKEKNEAIAQEIERLQVEDILDLQTIKLPAEAYREPKRLTKFLADVEMSINKLILGVQELNRLTA